MRAVDGGGDLTVSGQAIGTLRVTAANDAVLAEVPLLALEAVDEAGVLGRAWDSIRLWIK